MDHKLKYISGKTIKLLGENFMTLGWAKSSSVQHWYIEEKMDGLDFVKIKNFYTSKDSIKRRDICTPTFITLFTIDVRWKQPKCQMNV